MNAAAHEQAVIFECEDGRLVGILHLPQTAPEPQAPADTAVVIIVGGPQYRAGSHRQFVLLARALASAGYPVLRFDYRGMGDSSGAARDFENVGADIAASIDALQHRLPAIRRVALWGLCDGASAALLYCGERDDARLAGLCLVNPWVRSDTGLARTHVKHYYAQRLAQREFWVKLLRGKVGAAAVQGLGRSIALARKTPVDSGSYHERMGAAWRAFSGKILLVLSSNDYTAKEFLEHVANSPAWTGALTRANVQRCDVELADHTFSNRQAGVQVQTCTATWLGDGSEMRNDETRALCTLD